MVVHYGPPNISGLEKKIEEKVEELKKVKWYQKWWGILILGIIASAIVAIIFYFL